MSGKFFVYIFFLFLFFFCSFTSRKSIKYSSLSHTTFSSLVLSLCVSLCVSLCLCLCLPLFIFFFHSFQFFSNNRCDNWKSEDKTRIQLEWVCLGLMILGYLSVLLSACSKFMRVPDEEAAKLMDLYDTHALKQHQSKIRRGKHGKQTSSVLTQVCRDCPIRCGRCCGHLVSFWNAIEFILLISLVVDLSLRWAYQGVVATYSPTQLFGDKYIDLTWPVLQYQTSINLSSLVMFLSVTKCFK